jgi:hypothetical protein
MKKVPPVKIASVVYRRGTSKEKIIIFTEALVALIVLELLIKCSDSIKGLRWGSQDAGDIHSCFGLLDLWPDICDVISEG